MRLPILLIGLVLIAGFCGVHYVDPGPLQSLRNAYFDGLQRQSPRPEPDSKTQVFVVDIDEESLAAIGQWPWPRSTIADLTDHLTDAGAAVVSFDMIFAEPDRLSPLRLADDQYLRTVLGENLDTLASMDTDRYFADALSRGNVVLGVAGSSSEIAQVVRPKVGIAVIGEDPREHLAYLGKVTPLEPRLFEGAAGVGTITVGQGTTNSVARKLQLFWDTPDAIYPSLTLETLRASLAEPNIAIWGESIGAIKFAVGPYEMPLTRNGEMWLRARWSDETRHISAHDVLAGNTPDLTGAIILVGTSASSLFDLWVTPLGETVPGVEIHAQAIEQILNNQHLIRAELTTLIERLLFVSAGLLVAAAMSLSGPLVAVMSGGSAVALIAFSSWLGFTRGGLLIDATFPFLATTVVFTLLSVYRLFVTDREARRIRRLFSHYVAPDVLRDIERDRHKVALGGVDQPVTVMFSDIRNFTELSGTLDAQSVVAILNRLFAELSREIMSTRGTIDKFMGDSVMAFWNAPVPAHDHAARACRAALAMRNALSRFNSRNAAIAPVQMGLGLDTGTVCVGNIGSRERFNYTAIGPAVNVASRLEAACRDIHYDILATKDVRDAAPDFAWLPAGDISAKGIGERIEAYILLGDSEMRVSEAFGHLSQVHDQVLHAISEGGDVHAAVAKVTPHIAGMPSLNGFYEALGARQDDFAVAV